MGQDKQKEINEKINDDVELALGKMQVRVIQLSRNLEAATAALKEEKQRSEDLEAMLDSKEESE